ncbi:GntR family transcriptional regulator [Microbacterium sp.]|jgi:GntR family transcriptional regulator|uniref:GntR family transcriptional regulator n=1 Tax=Microbacterium sp. TaxID=51671 RepID=UPI0026136B62|nr:GntR family transcriptional regulator [Microbacterium sp.]
MTAVQPPVAERDTSSAIDIYRSFRGLIVAGHFAANERLPSVRQTATDLGVSAGTAAKAYKMLEQDGLVITRTAAGTRVAPSAAVLSESVMRRIRALAEESASAGADLEDVIAVLRLLGSPQS